MMAVVRAVGVVLIVGAMAVTAAPPVAGFSLEVHEAILKDALGDGNTLSDEALKLVTGSFFGGGNLGSDRHQLSAERHFDGAKSPTDICALWKKGLNAALERAVQLAAPEGVEKRSLKDREEALKAFGEATHAIADFYSHTNWVELHETAYGQNPRSIPQAPILNQTCDPAAFPKDLQSGYFSLSHGKDGCPSGGPPSGFRYCHSQIAKDEAVEGHGKDKIGGLSYHFVARDLSVKATRTAWRALHDRIVARYLTDATDAECLFMKLAWDGERSCHRLWRVEGKIKTHQEYVVGDARLIYDLDLQTVKIKLQSKSVEYPGPKAPPVYAEVEGYSHLTGTICQIAISKGGVYRRCDPYKSETRDDGRLKVTPDPELIEVDWRVTFPGKKPACQKILNFPLNHTAVGTKQAFPDCPGAMPRMTPRVLKYSGDFKMVLDKP